MGWMTKVICWQQRWHSVCHDLQINSKSYSGLYAMDSGGYFPGIEAVRADPPVLLVSRF